MSGEDSNGSDGIGMTIKSMVQELYADMKVVRPIVEEYRAANVPGRLSALETDKLIRDTRSLQRTQFAGITNKTLTIVVLVCNLVLGAWVAFANGVIPGVHP